jgi:hypothetical protein
MRRNKLTLVRLDYQRDLNPSATSTVCHSEMTETKLSEKDEINAADLSKFRKNSDSEKPRALNLKGNANPQNTNENNEEAQHKENIAKLDKTIYSVQLINTSIQRAISVISIILFLLSLTALVVLPLQIGDIGLFMLWITFEIVYDILLTLQSFKYSKIRKPSSKTHTIKNRLKFYAMINSTQILALIILLIIYRLRDMLRSVLSELPLKSTQTIAEIKRVLSLRCLLWFTCSGATRILLTTSSILVNLYYYKYACKRSICDFVRKTKHKLSMQ